MWVKLFCGNLTERVLLITLLLWGGGGREADSQSPPKLRCALRLVGKHYPVLKKQCPESILHTILIDLKIRSNKPAFALC